MCAASLKLENFKPKITRRYATAWRQQRTMALEGKHALVTGGGRGIGRAIAGALTAAGASVTVIGRSEASLLEAVAAGEAADCAVADVTNAAQVKQQLSAAEKARGPIAILVNNAGSVESGAFLKRDPADFTA